MNQSALNLLVVASLAIASTSVATTRGDAVTPETRSGKYCIELNGLGLPAGYLNLRKIIQIEDASAKEKDRLTFYKAVKAPNSDEILYVFFISGWDDIYKVIVLDSKQAVIRRKFTYGSLHYPCQKSS